MASKKCSDKQFVYSKLLMKFIKGLKQPVEMCPEINKDLGIHWMYL